MGKQANGPDSPVTGRRTRVGTPGSMNAPLDTEVQSTGMIQPGAHPEFEQPTPLDNAESFFGRAYSGALKTLKRIGGRK